jgi:anti-anti-sigma factor
MSAGFEITVVNRNGRAIVFMTGEIGLSARGEIADALTRAREGSSDVIVDLSQVTFIDSSGLNALVRAHREASQGRFYVVGAIGAIRRVFEIAGVDGVLLEGSLRLSWHRVTPESGWRRWMTDQSTQDGAPMGEILEVGPFISCDGDGDSDTDGAQYLLKMDGGATLYGSLGDAMTAAGDPKAAAAAVKRGVH